ncbi:MAG: DUF6377 domain-containing protein [Candidatus Pseudobacter hemicellulosilyticus]|uniref:DUF6377 domain-containing protein n=1 Tax=Candidatus Pseudobacter hemicellulosilyticus TaxID=3121375 RepID=A0AAJ5WYL8_9BACT|nr:MAG: DUF6377 domain-containing protein [Pseudobacter sp.]
MKYTAFCLLLFCIGGAAFSQPDNNPLLKELGQAIHMADRYDAGKLDRIAAIRKTIPPQASVLTFEAYRHLFEEYKSFNYDSAYHYAKKQYELAGKLGNDTLLNTARVHIGFSLLSAGMYKETLEMLQQVNPASLLPAERAGFYFLFGRFYYDLGDFDNNIHYTPEYLRTGNTYLDSALQLYPAGGFDQAYAQGLQAIRSGNDERARTLFYQLLTRPGLTDHQLAVTASTLSDTYIRRNQDDSAIHLLLQAAIADIRSSTRETSAIFNLAALLYKKGDVKNAYTSIQRAIADASFYGARQRKVQVSAILPLIEGERVNIAESQKQKLIAYASVVTLLLLAVIALVVTVKRQVKKVQLAQAALMEAHARLQEINDRLRESNTIKEEYIGYFFNYNSDFFSRIERFKKHIDQKIADRKIDEIRFLVNAINLRQEREDLLKSFDKVFLTLFPGFVDGFNALFKPEDRVQLNNNEGLTTDLRIYALLRMGITDNEKIAHILEYSVNTIYTYKTRIRNKAIVPKEEFEQRIMDIK